MNEVVFICLKPTTPKGMITALHADRHDKQTRNIDHIFVTCRLIQADNYHKAKYTNEGSV